jgi:hypothetical protein
MTANEEADLKAMVTQELWGILCPFPLSKGVSVEVAHKPRLTFSEDGIWRAVVHPGLAEHGIPNDLFLLGGRHGFSEGVVAFGCQPFAEDLFYVRGVDLKLAVSATRARRAARRGDVWAPLECNVFATYLCRYGVLEQWKGMLTHE